MSHQVTVRPSVYDLLTQIGATLANLRPDLNEKLSNDALVDAAIRFLWMSIFVEMAEEDRFILSCNAALQEKYPNGSR